MTALLVTTARGATPLATAIVLGRVDWWFTRLKFTTSQTLRTLIGERGLAFGDTPTGADWCIKALHPSDPLTEVRGIPDHSAVPSLLMNYQSTFTVTPAPNAEGTWSFNALLLPHPIQQLYTRVYDSVYVGGLETAHLNPQLDGATTAQKYAAFTQLARRWRLAYQSVTVIQDGPDLANQGTLVAAQVPVAPMLLPLTLNAATSTYTMPYCAYFPNEYRPDFASTQSMPNAYFNKSKEGCYMPLKLTETCQDWSSDSEAHCVLSNPIVQAGNASGVYQVGLPFVEPFPFIGLYPAGFGNNPQVMNGQKTSRLLNNSWGVVCARNLAVSTSYTFYVRTGIEMQVSPSSTLAPQLKLSPPYDVRALDTYFAIARELKDGYPADYNDLGKIWDAISGVLKQVGPALSVIPGWGPVAASAAKGVVGVGDYVRRSRASKKASRQSTTRSAAQNEQAAREVNTCRALVPYRPVV